VDPSKVPVQAFSNDISGFCQTPSYFQEILAGISLVCVKFERNSAPGTALKPL